MIKVAELTRQGFMNGDISTVMSPRSVISWAQNALIFGQCRLRLPPDFPQQVRRGRAAADRRILPASLRQGPAGERGRQGLRELAVSEGTVKGNPFGLSLSKPSPSLPDCKESPSTSSGRTGFHGITFG
jgi:hypothetical protein